VLQHVRGVRRDGSAALDLCYVACGRLDGFYERKLSPWDTAAGMRIAREAGARVTTIDGGRYTIDRPQILAANDGIHDALVEVLGGQRPCASPTPTDAGDTRGS